MTECDNKPQNKDVERYSAHRHTVTQKFGVTLEKSFQFFIKSTCFFFLVFPSFDFHSVTKCLMADFTNRFNSLTVTNAIKTSPWTTFLTVQLDEPALR